MWLLVFVTSGPRGWRRLGLRGRLELAALLGVVLPCLESAMVIPLACPTSVHGIGGTDDRCKNFGEPSLKVGPATKHRSYPKMLGGLHRAGARSRNAQQRLVDSSACIGR